MQRVRRRELRSKRPSPAKNAGPWSSLSGESVQHSSEWHEKKVHSHQIHRGWIYNENVDTGGLNHDAREVGEQFGAPHTFRLGSGVESETRRKCADIAQW